MRRIWIPIFGLIIAIACAGYWYVFERDVAPTELRVLAGARGSDAYVLMSEISEVVERHSDIVRLKVMPGTTSSNSISAINRRRVDLATIESNTPAYADIKLVANLFVDYFLLVTRKPDRQATLPAGQQAMLDAAGVQPRAVVDLPEMRIAIPPSGSAANRAFWSVVDHYKVPPERLKTVAVDTERAEVEFLAGRVDAIFVVSSLRDPFLLSLVGEAGLRNIALNFVPIDQADAMKLKRPYLNAETVVKGAFDGALPLPKGDIVVPGLNRLLVAGDWVDEEAVRELVNIIFSNRLDLLIRMPLSSSISNPRDAGLVSLGLHEGAASFYDRDEPSFLQENAEPMALIVTIFAMLFSASLALRRSMAGRAKNRADTYNDQLLDIARRTRETNDVAELKALSDELAEVLETVVHALDTDKVTEEGFQSFGLLWGSVRDTLRDRQREVA
ncbi:TAXI family TRAP transporter solute-binding subunit [Ahrensia sp. R2A130]|uniref:TAXI family TRAP transporter solute-binding subunit n=1 Tax=Ahrensia sp. R2A130 TaxID=744979 RepID=UPI0001E0A477|nr:TAXI family TRAP transporter solute-binding subunit [Ahrensia sp. R2A130]EFL89665.1 putative trap transporter solute receptor taxi family protein [Ahrensia sp. R2A130]